MRTMIIAAVAALGLSTGAAFAQGGPVGYQEQVYGAQAFTNHQNETTNHFLGKDTVVGRWLHRSDSNQVAASGSSAKGG